MTVAPATYAVHRAELDALDAVLTLVTADRRRDPVAYRAVLHDDFTERVDAAAVALGADAALALAQERWRLHPARTVGIDDVSVALPHVFVRSSLREGTIEASPVVGVGYSVYEVDGNQARAASHYVQMFGGPAPAGASQPLPAPSAPLPDARVAKPRRTWRVAAVGLAAIVVQDLLIAAPVVAATARWGGGRAFLVLGPLYIVLALATALLTLRLLSRKAVESTSRVASFLDREVSGSLARRTLLTGGAFGFVVGAYLFSAAPTVWALHGIGIRRRLHLAAVVASVIWGCGFVAFYAGAATLIGL